MIRYHIFYMFRLQRLLNKALLKKLDLSFQLIDKAIRVKLTFFLKFNFKLWERLLILFF